MARPPRAHREDTASPLAATLARQFGGRSAWAQEGIARLYQELLARRAAHMDGAADRWRALFGRACGQDLDQAAGPIGDWAAAGDPSLAPREPALWLFAAQSYLALLVRFVADSSGSGGDPALADDVFAWPLDGPRGELGGFLDRCADAVAGIVGSANVEIGADQFRALYEAVVPRQVRRQWGEFYTPRWLVELVLDEAGYTGDPALRLLDPTCGSGAFLAAAVARARARTRREGDLLDRAELGERLLGSLAGHDLNPLAVVMASANLRLSLAGLPEANRAAPPPIALRDAIVETDTAPFDRIVGNPPWMVWDRLPEEYRRITKPLWERYGLFSLTGTAARHGGGKKDLSMLLTYVAADRWLKGGGRLALILTQTVFQTRGAGDGFRRFRLGLEGEFLQVERVHDLVALRPFGDAANWTSILVLSKGEPTVYPVPYFRWRPGEKGRPADAEGSRAFIECRAQPVDPRRPSSPWLVLPAGWKTDLERLASPADYRGYLGANSGGANAAYWLELLALDGELARVRSLVTEGSCAHEHWIEAELLYPLLRWGGVSRWRATPGGWWLLVQDPRSRRGLDPAELAARYPRTSAYLEGFREVLARRAAYRRYQHDAPFYSMYNIGSYTLAPLKVVWRRMDRRVRAAVVEPGHEEGPAARPVLPQETCVFIPATSRDEAHYLCAMLNSAAADFLVQAHSVRGGKGFGSPGLLQHLPIRTYKPREPAHARLAALSREAHQAAALQRDLVEIERAIDYDAGRLWGLADDEIAAIRDELRAPN